MLNRHRHHVQQDHDHDEDVELLVSDQLKHHPLRFKLSTVETSIFGNNYSKANETSISTTDVINAFVNVR